MARRRSATPGAGPRPPTTDQQEVAPDLRPIDDPRGWEIVATGKPTNRLVTVVSLRLDPPSAALIQRAARLQGLTQSEFVRRAALREAESAIRLQPVDVVFRPEGQVEPVTFGVSLPRTAAMTAGAAGADASLVAAGVDATD